MNAGKYLTVRLGTESFGFDVMGVQEIVVAQTIREVPGTPDFVRGVTNLRGGIVPVFDLQLRLGMSAQEMSPTTCIVIFDVLDEPCGLLVDEIYEVVELSPDQIHPPLTLDVQVPSEFVTGFARIEDEQTLLLLLDPRLVLTLQNDPSLT
jgi:purine-binding chemotaxis protein CheW